VYLLELSLFTTPSRTLQLSIHLYLINTTMSSKFNIAKTLIFLYHEILQTKLIT